jgi:hypothetical protein
LDPSLQQFTANEFAATHSLYQPKNSISVALKPWSFFTQGWRSASLVMSTVRKKS